MNFSDFVLGVMGGEGHGHPGGGASYLCLPHKPKYDKYKDGHNSGAYIYGMKSVNTTETLFRELFTTMRPPALCASSSHVAQC